MKIENKKAFHDYSFLEKIEAGIVLTGSEAKAVREGRIILGQSFVKIIGNEAWLVNAHIPPIAGADTKRYDPLRSRKLLLHKKQLERVKGFLTTMGSKGVSKNLTVVPVSCYITHNRVKLEIAIARGKKEYEKREDLKKRDMDRDVEIELRGKEI